jgi:hypothetical protein
LSRREKQPTNWRTESGAASASGGHLPPETEATGPLLDPLIDPLVDPLPQNDSSRPIAAGPARQRFGQRVAMSQAAEAVPAEEIPPFDADKPRARRIRRKPRPAVRRVKRTLKHVDPLSVLKLSLFYYACFLLVWMGFVAVLYWIVQSLGVFDTLDELNRKVFFLKELDLSMSFFMRWAFMIGLALTLIGSLVNTFLAFLYNIGSDVLGGVSMTFVERDL